MVIRLVAAATAMITAVSLTSCGSDRVGVDELPVPDLATEEPFEGSFEVPLDNAISRVRDDVDFDEDPGERILSLPDDVDPDEVFAFYAEQFDEYSSEGDPTTGRRVVYGTWRNGDQRIVVAVVDASTGEDPVNFLVLMT
jgi:hypothetical protein